MKEVDNYVTSVQKWNKGELHPKNIATAIRQ